MEKLVEEVLTRISTFVLLTAIGLDDIAAAVIGRCW